MSRKLCVLMLLIIAVGVAHMAEQMMFGIEEYYMLRGAVGAWHQMFPPSFGDRASVLLITVVVTAISLVFFALMRGGPAPLVVAGLFGVMGIGEAHHWIQALQEGGYEPGVATSFLYVAAGASILLEVVREFRRRPVGRQTSAQLPAR